MTKLIDFPGSRQADPERVADALATVPASQPLRVDPAFARACRKWRRARAELSLGTLADRVVAERLVVT